MQPGAGAPPPGGPGTEGPGWRIWQHYQQQNVPQPMLMRIRNHLMAYRHRGGNMVELEQMVMSQNLPPQQLLQFIESKIGPPQSWGPPPGGAHPGPGGPGMGGGAGPRPWGGPGGGGAPPSPSGAAPPAAGPPPVAPMGGPGGTLTCKYCGSTAPTGSSVCPKCSAPFG